MRARLVFAAFLLLGTTTLGCFDFLSDDKSFDQDTTGGGTGAGGTGGSTTSTTGGGGSGTGGTTTTPEAECTPSLTSDAIDATCGVFASPNGNDDTGDGTKENPYATLTKALGSLTDKKTVYACTDLAKPFEEAVSVADKGVFIFGGLDCSTWIYSADNKTPLTAAAGEIPLTIKSTGSVHIEDFSISAVDAPALGAQEFGPGKSSIAILAQAGSTLELTRCDVAAGKGSDGSAGEPPTGTGTMGLVGDNGTGGCASAQGEFGGAAGQNVCDGTDVSGGLGGNGTIAGSGGPGGDGLPLGMTGKGGLAITGAITCDTNGSGQNGVAALPADPGKGATTDALGMLSGEGFQGARGGEGPAGLPGQGGGGGGGAPKCANNKAGPSGGGGGAGGCGGVGGKGGYGGGSSIAIASLGGDLKFSDVTLRTNSGGSGGAGASGQDGGPGGAAGMPGPMDGAIFACPGGKGGAGGKGGRGGGGRGGHSIGIAFIGDAPDLTGVTVTLGTKGDGGMGIGDNAGAAGVAIETQAF